MIAITTRRVRWGVLGVLTLLLVLLVACQRSDADVPGYHRVTSQHDNYHYLIPADWSEDTSNSYKGESGKVIEEIYPGATISEAYCASFEGAWPAPMQETSLETRVYTNKQGIEGCLITRDVLNTETGIEWRHQGFRFVVGDSVESVGLIFEKAKYDQATAMTILDSIQLK